MTDNIERGYALEQVKARIENAMFKFEVTGTKMRFISNETLQMESTEDIIAQCIAQSAGTKYWPNAKKAEFVRLTAGQAGTLFIIAALHLDLETLYKLVKRGVKDDSLPFEKDSLMLTLAYPDKDKREQFLHDQYIASCYKLRLGRFDVIQEDESIPLPFTSVENMAEVKPWEDARAVYKVQVHDDYMCDGLENMESNYFWLVEYKPKNSPSDLRSAVFGFFRGDSRYLLFELGQL
jgi:hypothetical protein